MLVRATRRGQTPHLCREFIGTDDLIGRVISAAKMHEPGDVFDCPPEHIALVSEHATGVGWMELVNEGDHARLLDHRAGKAAP